MTAQVGAAFQAKAQRALDATRLLLNDGETEGACNRAYYAMYYAARVALIRVKDEDVEYKTHRGLVAEFGKRVVLGGHMDAEFGRSLNEIQRLRELADYLGDAPSIESATSALDAAARFVAAIQAFDPS